MEVTFRQQRLAKQFNSAREIVRVFGPEAGKQIQRRLVQLEAATCLEDLRNAPGRCHELIGNRSGQLSIDLNGPYRLIFVPTAQPAPTKVDGGLNWSEVDAVIIIEILDTHEK
jgi:proteic killer suppression protein